MKDENSYSIPKGSPALWTVSGFGAPKEPSLPDMETTGNPPPAPVASASPPPIHEEKASPAEVLPWELLNHIDKTPETKLPDIEPTGNPSAPVSSASPPPIHEEKASPEEILPWEQLNHIDKTLKSKLPEPASAATDNTTAPSELEPAAQKTGKPHLRILPRDTETRNNSSKTGQRAPIEIPQSVFQLLETCGADSNTKLLLQNFMEDIPEICPDRITLSIQDNTICIWNYDEGIPFSFFRVIEGLLYCGIESSFVPKEESKKIWTPPDWLFPEPVSFFPVSETTPLIFSRIEQASRAATQTTTKKAL